MRNRPQTMKPLLNGKEIDHHQGTAFLHKKDADQVRWLKPVLEDSVDGHYVEIEIYDVRESIRQAVVEELRHR